MTATTETTTGVGRVARVTGPVVDVEFPVDSMPEIREDTWPPVLRGLLLREREQPRPALLCR